MPMKTRAVKMPMKTRAVKMPMKTRAVKRRRCTNPNDRISNLPDDILLQILSYLKIKPMYRTRFLSTRFRDIAKSTLVLDFSQWWHPFECEDRYYCECKPRADFDSNIDQVLLHNNTRVKQCILDVVETFFDTEKINEWISALVERKVQELNLSFFESIDADGADDEDIAYLKGAAESKLCLPQCLFKSKTLTSLELTCKNDWYRRLQLPRSFSLPRLKTLVIAGFQFENKNLTSKFFSCCPVLEELDLENCIFKNMNAGAVFQSVSSTIKVLRLHVFKDLFCVQGFEISSLPIFHKLVSLDVAFDNDNIGKLIDFLHLVPNLESLVFCQSFRSWNTLGDDREINVVPRCLLLNLQSVTLECYKQPDPQMMYVAKMFLKHAIVLQKFTLRGLILEGHLEEKNSELMKELQTLPRGSDSCQIEFV